MRLPTRSVRRVSVSQHNSAQHRDRTPRPSSRSTVPARTHVATYAEHNVAARRHQRLLWLLSLTIAVLMLGISPLTKADESAPAPSIDLAPDEVVQIVIEALRSNNPQNNDDGIATVFRFASPGNKSVTGPINRFTRMIKRGFSDMLNHTASEFGEIEVKESVALQAVWLTNATGSKTGYVFQLGKQKEGDFADMWMTESVWPIGKKEPEGQSI